jgi:hypothetical protein
MTNTYRALTKPAEAAYGTGVLELDLSVADEQDALGSGLLELVPRTYRVVSDNYVHPQGETFEEAFLIENEAALIAGGHIERVETPTKRASKPVAKTTAKRATKSTAKKAKE